MSKHTKGPWKSVYGYPYGIIVRAGEKVANTALSNKNWEADGKLIAAAPDLLKACELALSMVLASEKEKGGANSLEVALAGCLKSAIAKVGREVCE